MKKILLFLMYIITFPLHASLTDYKVATWNLQGSSSRSESKWNVNVRQMISGAGAVDILMVQEAGSPPASAIDTGRIINSPGIPVRELLWNLGSNSRPQQVYIYFSRIDVFAGRVNLAIVSQRRADDVIVLPPPSTASRPVLGIRIGSDAFFTAHALANRGVDAPAIVNDVFNFFRNSPRFDLQATNWMIAGDFNRSPDTLRRAIETPARNNTIILSPADPTQRSGGILDYAVIGNAVAFVPPVLRAGLLFGERATQISSDHYPVGFFLPPPGEPR
ncbi:cytolethal distending toxin subunit B family protein [Salmonella enterica subsp. enterica]|uniref:Cytolethal distending toxin subunit B family protein n=1 Tax=Salmonella enterica subsp. enterica serovar Aqua TaxID=1302615 RepID=A0A5X6ET42_SALET|nr:cytolethal distending toxin subunit B family protein [Salmonella enterica subsp. enterica serovar Bareilly]ECA3795565.1 cytolethal distending toxin subunit B family protein [Salmonella enterica subsp. enterica serovar Aqua]ECC9721832.1 cytolethal distending toxin subunit B family protein [Salmonella enterica subsp. diarizonae]EJM2521919.1 cytolethal distending toxin subunit B family protein [Salmonella enterica]HCM8928445.1 cytolethal distending toxin subunit B family protein [Salmonella ent